MSNEEFYQQVLSYLNNYNFTTPFSFYNYYDQYIYNNLDYPYYYYTANKNYEKQFDFICPNNINNDTKIVAFFHGAGGYLQHRVITTGHPNSLIITVYNTELENELLFSSDNKNGVADVLDMIIHNNINSPQMLEYNNIQSNFDINVPLSYNYSNLSIDSALKPIIFSAASQGGARAVESYIGYINNSQGAFNNNILPCVLFDSSSNGDYPFNLTADDYAILDSNDNTVFYAFNSNNNYLSYYRNLSEHARVFYFPSVNNGHDLTQEYGMSTQILACITNENFDLFEKNYFDKFAYNQRQTYGYGDLDYNNDIDINVPILWYNGKMIPLTYEEFIIYNKCLYASVDSKFKNINSFLEKIMLSIENNNLVYEDKEFTSLLNKALSIVIVSNDPEVVELLTSLLSLEIEDFELINDNEIIDYSVLSSSIGETTNSYNQLLNETKKCLQEFISQAINQSELMTQTDTDLTNEICNTL